ncbi:hypothetical protein YC2023_089637 [Brassica napus]
MCFSSYREKERRNRGVVAQRQLLASERGYYINKGIAAGEDEGAGFITPQKMLLNSIEMVEKRVTSELHRMQSTRQREERATVVKHLVSLR